MVIHHIVLTVSVLQLITEEDSPSVKGVGTKKMELARDSITDEIL